MASNSKKLYDTFANQISEYVQDNLDQDIVIEDLAVLVGLSKYHLNRLFQATTGFQLGEFIQRRRLQKAYALLASGKFSVIDVSLAVGYESHSAFSRAFFKAFNCKPSDVKLDVTHIWKSVNNVKNISKRDKNLKPEIVELPARHYRGLYGAGFKDNSFVSLAESLFKEIGRCVAQANLDNCFTVPIGVSLESPWQGDQTATRFFAGIDGKDLPANLPLDSYILAPGKWAKFQHLGSYDSMWQTISRVYAGWIIPEAIALKDDAIVQAYLNNPKTTAEAELITELYFPIQS
jgi:AraC family transcriptional regulator